MCAMGVIFVHFDLVFGKFWYIIPKKALKF